MSGDLPTLRLNPRPALLDDAGLRAVMAALGAGAKPEIPDMPVTELNKK